MNTEKRTIRKRTPTDAELLAELSPKGRTHMGYQWDVDDSRARPAFREDMPEARKLVENKPNARQLLTNALLDAARKNGR